MKRITKTFPSKPFLILLNFRASLRRNCVQVLNLTNIFLYICSEWIHPSVSFRIFPNISSSNIFSGLNVLSLRLPQRQLMGVVALESSNRRNPNTQIRDRASVSRPMFQHIVVEAENLEAVCKKAISDDIDWDTQEIDSVASC